MAKTPKRAADDMRDNARDNAPNDDDAGLINDEYTDDSLDDPFALDALDVPAALEDESVLVDMADDSDGIEELDVRSARTTLDNDQDGTAVHRVVDDAEMGLAAEPHTPEELADAAIGHELRGRGAVRRDDELHGELLFDRIPDEDAHP